MPEVPVKVKIDPVRFRAVSRVAAVMGYGPCAVDPDATEEDIREAEAFDKLANVVASDFEEASDRTSSPSGSPSLADLSEAELDRLASVAEREAAALEEVARRRPDRAADARRALKTCRRVARSVATRRRLATRPRSRVSHPGSAPRSRVGAARPAPAADGADPPGPASADAELSALREEIAELRSELAGLRGSERTFKQLTVLASDGGGPTRADPPAHATDPVPCTGDHVTTAEAAAYARVSVETVRRHHRDGQLTRCGGRRKLVFDRAEVVRWFGAGGAARPAHDVRATFVQAQLSTAWSKIELDRRAKARRSS